MNYERYMEELYKNKFEKHRDEIRKIVKFLRKNYEVSNNFILRLLKGLNYLQMAYWGTDDIIDEGNNIERRIEELLQIHIGINNFYNWLVFNFSQEIVERVLNSYNKAFKEMIEVPLELYNTLKLLRKECNEEIIEKIMELRSKHVILYWYTALAFVEKDENKIKKIARYFHLKRTIELIDKDRNDREIDKISGEFNIYNFAENVKGIDIREIKRKFKKRVKKLERILNDMA